VTIAGCATLTTSKDLSKFSKLKCSPFQH